MRYLLLSSEPRGQREARSDAEARACYAEMVAFGEGLGSKLLASESLRPTATACACRCSTTSRCCATGRSPRPRR